MRNERLIWFGAAAAGAVVAGTGCSTSALMGDAGLEVRPPSVERRADAAPPVQPSLALVAVNRAEIDRDLKEMVNTAGLAVDPAYDPALLGRVSLRWRPDADSMSLSDRMLDSDGERLGFGLAEFAPWSTEPGAAEIAVDFQGDVLQLDYQVPFTASAPGGIDVNVAPRARVVSGDVLSGAAAGAVVRFGRNLSQPRVGSEKLGWHFFVGADAQALTWKVGRSMPVDRAVRVEDFQMIGDIQAGIGMEAAGGDLAFGVVQREVSHYGATARERFTGVTYKVEF